MDKLFVDVFVNDYPVFYPDIEDIAYIEHLQESLKTFVKQPLEYKKLYLQKNYNIAFDGYSYMGQEDSSHQAADDLLHSFVLSNLQNKDVFPKEFQSFLQNDFERVINYVKDIERRELKRLQIFELGEIYDELFGHMVSCNYYPAISAISSPPALRLTAHKDISLFTTFPLGVSAGFAIGEQIYNSLPKTMVFSGYFLEWYTKAKIPAIYHRIVLPENSVEERYGFSFFSIPKPGRTFPWNGRIYSSDEYYNTRPALV